MSSFTIIEAPPYDLWNSFLQSSKIGNLAQTFEYGETMRKAYPQIKVVRLLATENGKPVGLIQGHYEQGRVL